ncbi:Retrotransposon gag protein [Gossypium australe]|uniref:Retrotransposon gag protein n=1 Tax=Gossypium australe TaxID=47621 RepID=A0A5B6UZY8_9ROSI|nr:Retrotransposon gag protein [Gossypium australe]
MVCKKRTLRDYVLPSLEMFTGIMTEDESTSKAVLSNLVTDDAIRLWLFPFSLIDNAFSWLDSQTLGSITTWDEFFFPISKTVQLRRKIATFKQLEGESFHEAWECFKIDASIMDYLSGYNCKCSIMGWIHMHDQDSMEP